MFSVRKPRGFQHNYIYYDPRKEKLKEIDERAKRELGLLPPKEFEPEDIRGKFVQATKHLKRRKEKVNYYLDIADTVLQRSTCLRRKYGAIIGKAYYTGAIDLKKATEAVK